MESKRTLSGGDWGQNGQQTYQSWSVYGCLTNKPGAKVIVTSQVQGGQ